MCDFCKTLHFNCEVSHSFITSRENKEPRNVKLLHPTLLITCSWNRDAVSTLQKQCLLSQCESNERNIPDYSDETAVCLTGENKDHSLND